ncbi:MAG: HYR domain-containing protein, partial [Mongoliibacter sp.]|uniref:HYR domain-containing protein n=1 Tax=Mongoliibacter sp. TaxID=2022438 RepID=UPI0012F0043B
PSEFPLGQNTVIWTIIDGSGNSATAEQIVNVTREVLPTITAPADITVDNDEGTCQATGIDLGTPEVTGEDIPENGISNNAPESFPVGTTVVTWTVIDGNGNQSTAFQNVTVVDNEAPSITAPANISTNTVPSGCDSGEIDLGEPVTSDNCGVDKISNDAPLVFPLGTTVVTWTVIDVNGNEATSEQTVTVVDNEAPLITAPANINIQLGPEEEFAADVELGQPTVSDNCSIASVTNDAPNSFALGINTVIWTVIDESGNMATAEQLVVVKKEEACVVTAKAKATITLKINSLGEAKLTTAMVDDGSFATCGPLRLDLSKFDFSCDDLGENMVKLIATDAEDNIDEAEFKVIVLDEERPKIKIKKAAFVWMMRAGDTFTMPDFRGRVEASDNCGFELIQHPAPGTQYRKPVNFFVEFEAKDLSGNISKERFRFILLVSKNKGPVRKNNKEIEFVDSGLWSVPWNTPFNWLVKEEISFEEGSDPEAIRQIKWNPLGYDPLIPGFYQIGATLLNESFNGFDAEMSLPVIVESKPLPEDILISRNLVPDKVHSGETIGSLKTIDPVDNVHIYTIDDHPNFHIDKDVLIWKGNGQPDAVMKVNVHSTDRAGQTISRELTLYREVDPNSILVYPNPAKQETNILVQLSGESDVTIRVFDAAGRSVYEEHSHQSETFVRNLDLRELSSGMYHIVVQIDKRVLTGRLVKGL